MAYQDPFGNEVVPGQGDETDEQIDQTSEREERQAQNRQDDREMYVDPIDPGDETAGSTDPVDPPPAQDPTDVEGDPFVDESGDPVQFGIDYVRKAVANARAAGNDLSPWDVSSGTAAYQQTREAFETSVETTESELGLDLQPVHVLVVLVVLGALYAAGR